MIKDIAILLSTYNGEKYLEKQLDSLLAQRGVTFDVYIRDDGSSDNTISVINSYIQNNDNIYFEAGTNIGFAKSFWNILQYSGVYRYYAFCDQDDIWFQDKLFRAVSYLENYSCNNWPLLYTSNVICIDEFDEKLELKPFIGGTIDVYKSFQQSILPGCTFVFNYKAKQLIEKYNGHMYSHDWATYIIINSFGKIFYDDIPKIKYRIHSENTIGINTKYEDIKNKIKRFFSSSLNTRSRFARDFYETYKNCLDNDLKKHVYLLGHYNDCINIKLKLICDKEFKGVIFKLYVILNKI